MRRPNPMRMIGFTRYEYQLIGEIVVLSGMIEQDLKEMIVRLVRAPWPDGIAMVTHQNFGSLCDMALALLPSTVGPPDLENAFRKTIKKAKELYDDRNTLVHGPFSPYAAYTGSLRTTHRVTARRKVAYAAYQFDKDAMRESLKGFIEVYLELLVCGIALEEVRGEQEPLD